MMGRVAWMLVAALVLATTGCAGAAKRAHARAATPSTVSLNPLIRAPEGPLVADGDKGAGGVSGLWGDTMSGPDGDRLGCIPGRRYAQAVGLRNVSNRAVTLIAAAGRRDRAPRIIKRVATQFNPGGAGLRHWSATPTRRPVTIPAGRSAAVQSDFGMTRCEELAGGRTLVVPGELLLRYRAGGAVGREQIAEPPIILTRGPTTQSCPRAEGGSSLILAADTSCRVARQAAAACHALADVADGTCMSNGKLWECGRRGRRPGYASTEQCLLRHDGPHWFRVSWKHGA